MCVWTIDEWIVYIVMRQQWHRYMWEKRERRKSEYIVRHVHSIRSADIYERSPPPPCHQNVVVSAATAKAQPDCISIFHFYCVISSFACRWFCDSKSPHGHIVRNNNTNPWKRSENESSACRSGCYCLPCTKKSDDFLRFLSCHRLLYIIHNENPKKRAEKSIPNIQSHIVRNDFGSAREMREREKEPWRRKNWLNIHQKQKCDDKPNNIRHQCDFIAERIRRRETL